MADRSKHPIVHFVGSIPLPDSETVFRTLSQAVGQHLIRAAGRRDRHPQDLDQLPAGRAGREPGDRGRQGRAAVQVHAMGRQAGARNPAPARQARRHARSRHLQAPAMPTWRSNPGRSSTACRRRASFPPASNSRSACRRRSRRPTTTWCRPTGRSCCRR